MNTLEKLEWIHCAIQEAQNGNDDMLTKALEIVEGLREPYLKKINLSKWKEPKATSKKDKLIQGVLSGEIIG